ncbi:fimbrial biogenesis chaperone [Enterobacter sp. 118C5]|uniref:fimbrial biogenesis chaperone n=1 Tax=Enterobacter TaxID=547 RepID=UPI002A7F7370|nr:molecular chaperone [Enterobacter sp. 118C5]
MNIFLRLISGILIIAAAQNTYATVAVGGTRVLYDGSKKEVSISVRNPDATPYLIQTVVNNLTENVQKPPFVITPPLYRLNGGNENLMRIILTGTLPQDRESMYWLRIKAIPSAPREKNTLQIAVATNIKLIYRPAALKNMDVEKESAKLSWRIVGNKLEVTNASPCFINFNEITLAGKKLTNVSWAAPESTTSFTLPSGVTGGNLKFNVISDFGAIGEMHTTSI